MPGMREAIIDLTTLQPATFNFLKFENWETKSTPPIPSGLHSRFFGIYSSDPKDCAPGPKGAYHLSLGTDSEYSTLRSLVLRGIAQRKPGAGYCRHG